MNPTDEHRCPDCHRSCDCGVLDGNNFPEGCECECDIVLYREGDTVIVQHLIYPGPRPFTAEGRVIKCLSPTYYEIEYIDHRGKTCIKRFRRGQLP